eukprot:4536669-Amphidinium_carterae.4
MAEETRKQYVTVTGEGLTIQGWKETTLISGTITVQPYIKQFGNNNQLLLIGAHLYIASWCCLAFTPMRYSWTTQYRGDTILQIPTPLTALIVGDIEKLNQQANIPRQLRQPR